MRLYIAGPMSGYPGFNYDAFEDAAMQLRTTGYTVLCPTDSEKQNPTPGTPQSWDWYMRHALRMVLAADGVAVLNDWQTSRGARLEVDVALSLQLPVKPLALWHPVVPS